MKHIFLSFHFNAQERGLPERDDQLDAVLSTRSAKASESQASLGDVLPVYRGSDHKLENKYEQLAMENILNKRMKEAIKQEWEDIAHILDRALFFLFTTFFAVFTIAFVAYSQYNRDNRRSKCKW